MLNIRLQKFAHIEGLDVLYFSLGLMLCISVPIASIGPSFVAWPNLAMFAAVGLSVMAIRDFPAVIRSMSVNGRILLSLILFYLVFDTWFGFVRFDAPMQYPLWSIGIFFLWLLVIPWLFLRKGGDALHLLAWGVLSGAIVNAFAVMADGLGYSPALNLLEYLDPKEPGAWVGLLWMHSHGGNADVSPITGVGLFSYSRTVTGFFLGVSTALSFLLLQRVGWRLLVQVILLVGILYTGSRMGALTWLLVMIIGHRNIGVRNIFLLIIVASSLIALIFSVFGWGGIHARALGAGDSLQGMLSIRNYYQFQAIPSDLLSLQFLFGSGPGLSAITMGWDKLGLNMYEAHGTLFQYLADAGIVGLILYLTVVGRVLIGYLRCAAVWGLIISFGVSHIVDGFFFPKPQAVYFPIVFAIIFLVVGSQYDKVNNSKNRGSA